MREIRQKLVLFAFALSLATCMPLAAKADTVNGKCGDTATFSYDTASGLLTISGTGKVSDTDEIRKVDPKSVVIQAGITDIYSGMFEGKKNLESITLPEGLQKMGCGVFYECTALKEIKIPASLESTYGIGHCIFEKSGLEKIEFADGTKFVYQDFCKEAANLNTVILPETVTEIRSGAFENCTSLAFVTIPANVTQLGAGTFGGCIAMKEIVIPTKISGLYGVGNGAFENSGIEKVTFAEGTETICHNLCKDMPNLKSVTLPESVKEIGHDSFANCPNLESINMYQNCQKFWQNIFSGSSKVVITGYAGTEAETYAKKNGIAFNSLGYIPPKMNETAVIGGLKYKVTNPAIDGTGQVSVVCAEKKNIKSVTIPEKVTIKGYSYNIVKIENKAFFKQSKLKNVTIKSQKITKIGAKAFKGIQAKAVIKVPKAKKKAYSGMLKKAGVTKQMKIK